MLHKLGSSNKRPFLLEVRSSKWFILSTITLAIFTDIFLYGVIVPVIPFALESRSHVPSDQVQYWVSVLIAIYGASLLAFSLPCGVFSDRTNGRQFPLLLGLLALLGSTVLLNVAPNTAVLVLGRVLQGCSAAVVWVVGLALLADTVPPDQIAQSMGYIGIGLSLGMFLAPLLGGVVFDRGGYNAVFAMCYAIIGLDIVMRLLLIEKKDAARWLTETSPVADEENKAAAAAAVTNSTPPVNGNEPVSKEEATNHVRNNSQASAENPPLERVLSKRRYKLPPIIFLLSSRRLLAALWASLAQASLLSSFDSVVPIHVNAIFHWSSTGAGLIFLPIVIPTLISPFVGMFADKFGARWPATAGFVMATPLYVCLRFVDHNSIGQKVLLCALLALIGLAMTLALPPLMAEITYLIVAKEEKHPGLFGPTGAYAQAYGLFNMAFAGGCIVGPLWAGFISSNSGWGTMGWTLGLLSFFTAVITAIGVGGRKKTGGEEPVADRTDTQVENA